MSYGIFITHEKSKKKNYPGGKKHKFAESSKKYCANCNQQISLTDKYRTLRNNPDSKIFHCSICHELETKTTKTLPNLKPAFA